MIYHHFAYLYLTECLVLYEQDARLIEKYWGWMDDEIYESRVRSVPSQIFRLVTCSEMARRFDLSRIAGFYNEGDRWRLNIPSRGLLKPYRDDKRRIIGLLVYSSVRDRNPKLLDSRHLPQGSPAIVYDPYGREAIAA